MWRAIAVIAEERIQEAFKRGEFDDLPGKGQPLNADDACHVPEELRMAWRIMKNADCLPPEIEMEREIANIEDLLAACPDEAERARQMKRLGFLVTKLNQMRNRPVCLDEESPYYAKAVGRVRARGAKKEP